MKSINAKIKEVENEFRFNKKSLYEDYDKERKDLEERFEQKETDLIQSHVDKIIGKII